MPHPRAEARGHVPQPPCLGWMKAPVHLGNQTQGSPSYPKAHLLPTLRGRLWLGAKEKQEEEKDVGCEVWP